MQSIILLVLLVTVLVTESKPDGWGWMGLGESNGTMVENESLITSASVNLAHIKKVGPTTTVPPNTTETTVTFTETMTATETTTSGTTTVNTPTTETPTSTSWSTTTKGPTSTVTSAPTSTEKSEFGDDAFVDQNDVFFDRSKTPELAPASPSTPVPVTTTLLPTTGTVTSTVLPTTVFPTTDVTAGPSQSGSLAISPYNPFIYTLVSCFLTIIFLGKSL